MQRVTKDEFFRLQPGSMVLQRPLVGASASTVWELGVRGWSDLSNASTGLKEAPADRVWQTGSEWFLLSTRHLH